MPQRSREDVTDEVPSAVTPYKYLTGEEHDKKMNNELNKKKDPCEKELECKQDKEVRTTAKSTDKLNWEHKD